MQELATLLLQCDICYENRDFIGDKTLNCGHGFHAKCIDGWLARAKTCPMCRRYHRSSALQADMEVVMRCYAPINVAQVKRWPKSATDLAAKIDLLISHGAAIVTCRQSTNLDVFKKREKPHAAYAALRILPVQNIAEYTTYNFAPIFNNRMGVSPDAASDVKRRIAFSPFNSNEGYIRPDAAIWRAAIARVLGRIEKECVLDEQTLKVEQQDEYAICSRDSTLGIPFRDDDGYSGYSGYARAYQD